MESLKNRFTSICLSRTSQKRTTPPKQYIWDLKLKHNETPPLKWHDVRKLQTSVDNAPKRNPKISNTQTQISYLIKDPNLFQSAAT